MNQADDKLQTLCNELSKHREQLGPACASQFETHQPTLDALADRLPLVHGINDQEGLPDLKDILSQQALRSAADRDPSRGPKDIEKLLGLPSCVYTSAGVLYPQKNVALLFHASVEKTAPAEASPWDSGTFGRHFKLKNAPEEERVRVCEIFQSNCLPAPQYRRYFASYTATFFGNLDQYLSGRKCTFQDAIGLVHSESFGARIFEVRFSGRIPASENSLLAVFVRDKAGNEAGIGIKRLLTVLKQGGVHVDYYSHNSNLNKKVQDFIQLFARTS